MTADKAPYDKPSDAVKAGACPSCLGTGRVERVVPTSDIYPCSTCAGSGKWPPPFVCPRCGAMSFNETDAKEGYCGACHDWTADERR